MDWTLVSMSCAPLSEDDTNLIPIIELLTTRLAGTLVRKCTHPYTAFVSVGL